MAARSEENRKPDKIKCLELSLDEQHRDYETLHSLHEGVKIKNVTFLAAAFALLGYLYAGNPDIELQERLFIPNQPYGRIFYALGLVLLFSAIGALMVALVKTRNWHTAYDNEQDDSLLENYEKYLIYMRKRYLKISRLNGSCYERRRYLLNLSFMPLVLGATILLLLKTFGG